MADCYYHGYSDEPGPCKRCAPWIYNARSNRVTQVDYIDLTNQEIGYKIRVEEEKKDV